MRRLVVFVALFLASLPVPGAGAEGEVAARLVFKVGEAERYPLATISLTEEPPTGVKVPKGMEDARFARRNFGEGRELLVAVHFRPDPVWIRVDQDFDGDLTNEEPFYLTASGTVMEALVEVEVPLDPMGAPEKITLRFIHHHSKTSTCLHLSVPVHMEGEVVLGGRIRKIVLADGDHDLLFESSGSDRLFLDVDGDTEVKATRTSHEEITPGQPFRLGVTGWVADLSKNGDISFRAAARVPDISEGPWLRFGVAKAGKVPRGQVPPFDELRKEYGKAGEADKKAGANVFTNRSRVIANIGKTR
jgi:hypothetical protein